MGQKLTKFYQQSFFIAPPTFTDQHLPDQTGKVSLSAVNVSQPFPTDLPTRSTSSPAATQESDTTSRASCTAKTPLSTSPADPKLKPAQAYTSSKPSFRSPKAVLRSCFSISGT